ncbi:N-alkane-inducible cytochrome P450 [Thozetella sp. PMI_491]|nr:N-alkane-inducible cytochrome P450 [Thozetella sp. PMI_491]
MSRWVGPTGQFEKPVWYPHKDPVLGLDVAWICAKGMYRHNFLKTISGIISSCGKTVSYLSLGRQAIITVDPENLRAMLSERFYDFGLGNERTSGLRPLLGGGIFNSDGSTWKVTLRPFVSRVGETELGVIEMHVQNLLKAIPTDGTTIDLQKVFSSFTIDISTDLFLGASTNLLSLSGSARAEAQQFAAAFDYAQRASSGVDNYNLLSLFLTFLFGDSQLKESIKLIHGFIDEVLDRAMSSPATAQEQTNAHGEKDRSFLPSLLDNGRTREDIKYDIINITLAGKDTMTAFLSSIWYVLSQRPDVVEKIRGEISILDGRRPKKEDLKGFRYLHQVLQEVLRLYPPVALNQRTAECDTVLPRGGGKDGKAPLYIPRGASVGYSVHTMHRLPEFFGEDADVFRPERWDEINPLGAFMPFHSGPRRCLGQQLALSWAKYATVRLLQSFGSVEARNQEPWEEKLGLNCSSRHGVKVRFTAKSK